MHSSPRRAAGWTVFVAAAALAIAGCSTGDTRTIEASGIVETISKRQTISPEGTRRAFSRSGARAATTAQVQINRFLWRGALDTISFMPIASADAFGGIIVTDWYAPPETPKERFKINVYIQGEELRSDGVTVTLFREVRDDGGQWSSARVGVDIAADLENEILARARELRQTSLNR